MNIFTRLDLGTITQCQDLWQHFYKSTFNSTQNIFIGMNDGNDKMIVN